MSIDGPIVVVGAGPAGTLLSIYLARQGHDVTLYESRPDLRRTDIDAGRSINLALATRGIVPLIDVGVIEKVDAITIPMRGRMVHALDDSTPASSVMGARNMRSSTQFREAISTRSCSMPQRRPDESRSNSIDVSNRSTSMTPSFDSTMTRLRRSTSSSALTVRPLVCDRPLSTRAPATIGPSGSTTRTKSRRCPREPMAAINSMHTRSTSGRAESSC